MATYEITSPDGQIYEVTAPDNASKAAVLAYAKTQFAKQDIEKQSEQPKTAIQKLNEFSAPIGKAGKELYESLGHNIQKPFHNIANIAQQGVAGLALAAAPDSKFAQSLGKQAMEDEEATKRWEAEYQARVPDSPASYTGASIGSLLPFMASGAQQGMQALGHAGGQVAKGGLFSKVGSGVAQGVVGAGLTAPSLEEMPKSAAVGGMLGGALPVVGKVGGYLVDEAKDIGHVVGSAYGRQKSVEKLASDAAKRIIGKEDILPVKKALRDVTTYEASGISGAKPSVSEAITERINKKDKIFAGALLKMQQTLTGAKGAENVLPNAIRKQEKALGNMVTAVEAKYAPVREKILDNVDKVGIPSVSITNKIDQIASQKGDPQAIFAKNALAKIRARLDEFPESPTGRLYGSSLYTARKEINNLISAASKESGTWDKKVAANLESKVKGFIDDAIESTPGGKGWTSDYMEPYSAVHAAIRNHKARLEETGSIQSLIKSTNLSESVKAEVPQLPTLLSRPMMAVNFAIKSVVGDANAPVAKELSKRMADPELFAELLKKPKSNPVRKMAIRVLQQAAVSKEEEYTK